VAIEAAKRTPVALKEVHKSLAAHAWRERRASVNADATPCNLSLGVVANLPMFLLHTLS